MADKDNKKIEDKKLDEASGSGFFTYYNGRPAVSLAEAYEFYDYMAAVLD